MRLGKSCLQDRTGSCGNNRAARCWRQLVGMMYQLVGLVRQLIAIIVFGLSWQASAEPQPVLVGAYEFPPFFSVEMAESGPVQYQGAAVDMVEALNRVQNQYHLELFVTSPKRRYLDFEQQRYDVIFFESRIWGWEPYPMVSSRVFMGGGEVYVALKKADRDQHFFDDIAQRSLVGILGYHYGFSDFISNDEYLNTNYRIFLSSDHERNLQLILLDRPAIAEVAVVTRSYLNLYMRKHPHTSEQFLISDRYDQRYRHTLLAREGALLKGLEGQPATTEAVLNQWLDALLHSGDIERIREKYGLVSP